MRAQRCPRREIGAKLAPMDEAGGGGVMTVYLPSTERVHELLRELLDGRTIES